MENKIQTDMALCGKSVCPLNLITGWVTLRSKNDQWNKRQSKKAIVITLLMFCKNVFLMFCHVRYDFGIEIKV